MPDFNAIKHHFDVLNWDYNHFCNSNDICTPMDCVKAMVDAIPRDFWQRNDLKVLDSCCGNGNFHGYIATKTALNNLYFNEINEKRIKNLVDYFGEDINMTTKDFLTFEEKEEYDLVVSNPPYAKFDANNKRTSKNHNLSRDFIRKALAITKHGGYLLFIVPNNWMSYSDINTLPQELSRYQFVHLDIHGAKKWFPKVGSSFTWFLLHKVENSQSFTIANNYVFNDTQTATLDKKVDFIPLYYSDEVRSIVNKTLNNVKLPRYKIETNSFLHRYTKRQRIEDVQNAVFCYKLVHTPSQTVWSSVPHKFQDGYKVFISLTNQYGTFIDNCGMTQSIAYIRCDSKAEAERIENELNADVYKFLNNITRYGNFNNIRVLQRFPVLGSFELNEEETEFIGKFNAKYYAKSR
jgi:SAM-dependent methyltransferase